MTFGFDSYQLSQSSCLSVISAYAIACQAEPIELLSQYPVSLNDTTQGSKPVGIK